jgi:CRP-like cAMP-binding protein
MPVRTRLPIVSPGTGEILELDAIVYLYGESRGVRDRDFVKVFHAFLDSIFRDKEVMSGPFRLIAYILSEKLDRDRLDFNLTAQEAIAKLGITRPTFYRWLGILLRKGYLKRHSATYYSLKPYTAIVGKMANIDYFKEGQP